MSIVYGTGFEAGSKEIVPAADMLTPASISLVGGGVPSAGNFAMRLTDPGATNWIRFAVSTGPSEAWFSVFFAARGTLKDARIEFELSDGNTVGFRKEPNNAFFSAYRGNTNVADGSATVDVASLQLLQGHVKVADSGGEIDLIVGGSSDIAFTGDTKPAASVAIDFIRFYIDNSADFFEFDDLTVSDSEDPGEIHYISKAPDGDSAVTWTPSAGGTNYNLVDEIGPSDADYVETATNANQDLYTIADYALSFGIVAVVQWVRGLSTPSGGEFKMQIVSGATTSEESTSGLGTTAEYVSRILETDPNTSLPWGQASFNAITAGQEAVVTTETVRVTQHVLEIGYDQNASNLLRPLGIDVDLFNGQRVWATVWNNGTLFLKRISSSLATQAEFNFGAATEAEIDARTFYLSPYAPPFFDTANLDDIIYVYGRWDDGSVTHLAKSIDGGSSFSDIGDSATWLAGWVGAFFADDANTLYAFVNGASRALYRSINAGSTWTSLSSLPFDVDPGGVSVHPDGRILISNRDAGAQTAAYANSPDYASWVDATGSPSFPVSTPGNGINSIIWIT